LILDRTVYEGEFSGKAIGLKEYMKEYAHAEQHIQAGFGRKEKNLYRPYCIFGIQGI